MEKMLVLLMYFLFSQSLSAQLTASATATATATILHSVGAAEITDPPLNKTAVFKAEESFQSTGANVTRPAKTVDFAAFKVVGQEFVYSLSVALNSGHTSMKQQPQKKPLDGVSVKHLAAADEAYILSSLVDVSGARRGGYREETVYDITINFN